MPNSWQFLIGNNRIQILGEKPHEYLLIEQYELDIYTLSTWFDVS